jgi:hypothetical protein
MNEQIPSGESEVLATFEIRLRPEANLEDLGVLSRKLHEIARASPAIGEIAQENWTGTDGAVLVMYRFRSMAAMHAFVQHPEHRAAMRRAKEFFSSVRTRIAPIVKESQAVFGTE